MALTNLKTKKAVSFIVTHWPRLLSFSD